MNEWKQAQRWRAKITLEGGASWSALGVRDVFLTYPEAVQDAMDKIQAAGSFGYVECVTGWARASRILSVTASKELTLVPIGDDRKAEDHRPYDWRPNETAG